MYYNLIAILSIEYEKQKICSLISVTMIQLIAILYLYLQMDVSDYLILVTGCYWLCVRVA